MKITQSPHSATQAKDEITDRAADYRFWRKLSRCVRCHTKDAFTMNGHCMCAECAEKRSSYDRAYRQTHPEFREAQALWNKKRRERLKASGMCCGCGKRKAAVGKTLCVYCTEKINRRRRSAYAERHADDMKRGTDGMCCNCRKKPPASGYKLCAECYQKAVENGRKSNRSAHSWRADDHIMFEKKRAARDSC